MAKNELLPFANGEDANVLPTAQWEALTDILENGFQSGIAKSEQVNRVLAQGAVASYVLGQLIVDQLSKDATLDKNALYQNLILALQENAKDACLPLSGGNVTGNLTVQSKNVVRSVNGVVADPSGNVALSGAYVTETWKNDTSWYRKWSDGWIEQGGKINVYAGGKADRCATLTFNTPFSDANHTLSLTLNNGASGTSINQNMDSVVTFQNPTASTVVVRLYDSSNSAHLNVDWYACGY